MYLHAICDNDLCQILIISQASGYVRDDAVTKLIQLVSNTESLHTYTVQHLFRAIQDDKSQV